MHQSGLSLFIMYYVYITTCQWHFLIFFQVFLSLSFRLLRLSLPLQRPVQWTCPGYIVAFCPGDLSLHSYLFSFPVKNFVGIYTLQISGMVVNLILWKYSLRCFNSLIHCSVFVNWTLRQAVDLFVLWIFALLTLFIELIFHHKNSHTARQAIFFCPRRRLENSLKFLFSNY